MRALALFLGVSTLALAVGPSVVAADPVTLKIVHFNDLDRIEEDEGKGGVARLAAVVEEVRAGSSCSGDEWWRQHLALAAVQL
jgi:5'-nucleotidase/UDP-sugar diphosphatase